MLKDNLLSLARQSLKLDIDFLRCNYPLGFNEKFIFLIKKYFLLLKHLLFKRPPVIGRSRIKIANRWLYYESSFGLANFQAMNIFISKILDDQIIALKNPIIIDIGAHLGYFSILLADSLKKSQIYACEPVNLTFQLLKKNCQTLTNIHPFNIGFLDKKKHKKIFYKENELVYSSILAERFNSNHQTYEYANFEKLDDFIKEIKLKKIHILKIDTEGAEKLVIKGAKKTLAQTCYIIIESPMNILGEIIKKLTMEHNFHLYKIINIFSQATGEINTIDLMFKNMDLTKRRI